MSTNVPAVNAEAAAKIAKFDEFTAKFELELTKLDVPYVLVEIPGNSTYAPIYKYALVRFPEVAPYWRGYALRYYHVQAGWTPKRFAKAAYNQALWLVRYFPDEVLKPQPEEA